MEIGLLGQPLTGKTTFFNLLTGMGQETCLSKKRDVYTAVAQVPDERVDYLAHLYRPQKAIYAQVQIKDIPGVYQCDAAGMSNKHLEEARTADLLVQVVRAFHDDVVANIAGEPDPYKELADFATDLVLADMISVENQLARLEESRKPSCNASLHIAVLRRILHALENEQRVSDLILTEEEKLHLAGYNFFTEKPLVIAVNMDEKQFTTGMYTNRDKILEFAANHQIPLLEISARMEMEISRLPLGERAEFMHAMGLNESGICRLASTAYNLLGVVSFFTVGAVEVRAWTIRKGTIAKKAAGKVHSDMERGFIRAEVFHFEDLKNLGSVATVREKGLFRLEGKEYAVKDGDIINFRFNV
ncbi:MAG TPA: redox-regulated ATPase YchF [Firmicutes bacterium]|nr:redox-regulated ATPase YchF [Bacillota bacterium]